MNKPTKEQVIQTLNRYKTERKIIKNLACTLDDKTCFCIEGVFCQAASELGFPGEFKHVKKMSVMPYGYYISGVYRQEMMKAPPQIWGFLSIQPFVEYTFIQEIGEEYGNKIAGEAYRPQARKFADWYELNDLTTLTLAELINIAQEVLRSEDA